MLCSVFFVTFSFKLSEKKRLVYKHLLLLSVAIMLGYHYSV